MEFPDFFEVTQGSDEPSIKNLTGKIQSDFERLSLGGKVRAGKRVALAVGSRGISRIPEIVGTMVSCLKQIGLAPFILPAMGSHGGATAEGQKEILADLGVTEGRVGAPILSNMDVVSLGSIDGGAKIFLSRDAYEADYLVAINRVKPHTAFRNDVESGLCKMLTVGCGKDKGAANIHKYDLAKTIVPGARRIMEKVNVLCGLAVVETPGHEIARLEIVEAKQIIETDRRLLHAAWKMLQRIPVEDLDFLIIDEMGKNISGAGIDPNVIGLWRREGGERLPDYKVLAVLDVTPESHGNAMGIGMADLTTFRVREKLDMEAMYTNALTAWVLRSARMPLCLKDDKTLLKTVMGKLPDLKRARIGRITNTLALDRMWFTKPVLAQLKGQDQIDINEAPLPVAFSADNRLLPF
ncbi:DUF362 domain-containing protein [Desulfospira joergensenii]|uniref:DUF362 domain-containing protein n=1 Tax=Desulfospira joergensenii TaxID=53329 RepID=UPI0003B5C065|nr:DUF362 domain-containing protein [Desulfospira joergensenii]